MMIEMTQRPSKQAVQAEGLNGEPFITESIPTTRVVIVEPHLLIREALERVIANLPQIQILASFSRRRDLPTELAYQKGDVLILGSSLPVCECLEYVNAVQRTLPLLGIVVIQHELSPATTFPFIKHGVQGLLGEDASATDLAQAIVAASTGKTFLGQRARALLNNYVSRAPLHFTDREMQVLPLLRSGLSNFCIAQQLALKEKTVEKHLTHIYQKLHSHSRTEAILRIQTLHI